MLPTQQHSRINTAEVKALLVKKLGPEKASHYFYHLNRFLSQKISKNEFEKLCYLTIGRENLSLHNHLIQSILKNACLGKVPPPPPSQDASSKSVEGSTRKTPVIWSNGDALPPSPRKSRSCIRDRKLRDRPSPLGPNGKVDIAPTHQGFLAEGPHIKVLENGDAHLCDMQRPMVAHQGLAERPDKDRDISLLPNMKRPRMKRSSHGPNYGRAAIEVVNVEDGEEVEQLGSSTNLPTRARSPLKAPLGIPFCSVSVGGARKVAINEVLRGQTSSSLASDLGELSDTDTLRRRLEVIAEVEGLQGVTMDCANLLNNGLDTYLKKLIRSCIELAGSRSGHEQMKQVVQKQQVHGGKLVQGINGVWPNHLMHIQSASGSVEEVKNWSPISLLDFKVAMELNPQQLGEDWPLQLEKISMRAFEEE
ncbi:uncharacterized protein LOC18435597 [Amborella trichopoda]|uniref:Transcriptional coactivator Hfi1/Transcriptional adapter 1 n=1 Tax=Amborella trichopoda TaxID=13333 RepID=W1PHC8_AMBTC|nr:uncharacterized protein LOC18435597 [Amborella trichopoda]XP_020523720.1 uncharacterized protein LOC18435597 [Amborella trichopoda]ERN07378.1 hypothetical protein AMTR_s00019p00238830 [Amborella trichopoda]|eukprot:XP_006845703.1 uncharacterized protein LOC18435597 [Amborella trichopoda]